MTMLIGLPMWMSVIADRSRYLLTRLLAALCIVPILVAIPMTGSRGTLVAAAVVAVYLFRRSSIAGKTALLVAVSAVVLLASAFLADKLLLRYSTVVDTEQLSETAASESRVYLFKQGLLLILRHPITGVGVGMFAVGENDLAIEQGLPRGTWHTCHNMYVQVASEGGLPAFMLYCVILWSVWNTLGMIENVSLQQHPKALQIARLAFWLRITFLSLCACGLFLSVGLSSTFVIMVSLPVAFARIVRGEIAQLEEERNSGDSGEIAPLPRIGPTAAPVRGLRGEA
jgi:O-antigen ligase